MGADRATQKTRHKDRAEDSRRGDGVKNGAGKGDGSHDMSYIHREPGFLQHVCDLRGRKKLNGAVCRKSDNNNPAHYPASPQGGMQSHRFKHLF